MTKYRSFPLACVVLVGNAALAATAVPLPPLDDQALARELFKELVEIRTTHDRGSTVAARAIQQHLLRATFPESDVTFIAPADHPSKGNVVVRLRGAGKGKPVLFLGHLDVVEAKAEDWSVDPYKLTEREGWYFGRGTIDMKDGDAALLEALIRLRRENYVPQRDIIAAFTAGDSGGGGIASSPTR